MTKKQKMVLTELRRRIQEMFNEEQPTIADVVAYARNEMHCNVLQLAAIFELNKEDFYRFLDNGFSPPYFVNAFRRYFNIKWENYND